MTFQDFYEKERRPQLGSIYNLIVIMRYLEKYEGYDFSKPPENKRKYSRKKKYLMEDGNGREYFL